MIDHRVTEMCHGGGIQINSVYYSPDRLMSLRKGAVTTENHSYQTLILVDEVNRFVKFDLIHPFVTPPEKRAAQIGMISLLNNLLFCSRFTLWDNGGKLSTQISATLRVADSEPTVPQLTDVCANAALDFDQYFPYLALVVADGAGFNVALERLRDDIPGFDEAVVFN